MFSAIIWDFAPQIFPNGLFGFDIGVRWYGLLFAAGFLISQQILFHIFKKEGKPEKDVETLTVVMVIATIIGARLGHVLFYEPEKYFPNVLDIFKIWEGGLASHGAAIGILFGLWIYSRYDFKGFKATRIKRPGQSYLQTVDRIVILVALTGALIRTGNFMNSEIIGKPTQSDSGVIFARNITDGISAFRAPIDHFDYREGNETLTSYEFGVPLNIYLTFSKDMSWGESELNLFLDENVKRALSSFAMVKAHVNEAPAKALDYKYSQVDGSYMAVIKTLGIPRHPAQLYEAFSCIVIFLILYLIWNKHKKDLPEGRLLGLFLILIFGLRFFYEFLKENQVSWEDDLPLNMGQWLSIPLVLIGIWLFVRSYKSTTS